MATIPLDLSPVFYRRLREFARRRVADPALADDLAQEALARALASGSELRDAARFEAWLFRILRNLIADHYRGMRPVASFVDLGMDETALAAPDNDELAEAAEICVGAMLDAMEGDDRSVLAAVYRDDETQHDMARRLGIPASTARSRIQRARRRLQRALELCCRIELDGAGNVATFEPLAPGLGGRCRPTGQQIPTTNQEPS